MYQTEIQAFIYFKFNFFLFFINFLWQIHSLKHLTTPK